MRSVAHRLSHIQVSRVAQRREQELKREVQEHIGAHISNLLCQATTALFERGAAREAGRHVATLNVQRGHIQGGEGRDKDGADERLLSKICRQQTFPRETVVQFEWRRAGKIESRAKET